MTKIIWFTGMSGAGKSTLCRLLEPELKKRWHTVKTFDGDAVRELKKNNDFSFEGIVENNLEIINQINKEIKNKRYEFILVSVISPFLETRNVARTKWQNNYIEVYVKCHLDELIERDTKGLYRKYLEGNMPNMIGMNEIPYEDPKDPSIEINTSLLNTSESLNLLIEYLKAENILNPNILSQHAD